MDYAGSCCKILHTPRGPNDSYTALIRTFWEALIEGVSGIWVGWSRLSEHGNDNGSGNDLAGTSAARRLGDEKPLTARVAKGIAKDAKKNVPFRAEAPEGGLTARRLWHA